MAKLRNNDLAISDMGSEVVLLDLIGSTYFSAGGSGAILLRALAEGASEEALRAALVAHFAIDAATAEADVTRFLQDLAARDLLAQDA